MAEQIAETIKGEGLCDCHCHLLPSLDDGPEDTHDSVRMAAILYSFGFREICCTPHMLRGVYDNSPEKVDSALKELADALQTAGISMRLYSGMEYYLDEFFPLALEAPLPLPGSLILFEAPVQVSPDFLLHSTYRIIRKGFVPLLAHPERCGTLAGASELMEKLAGMGCLFQGNIGSFAGAYGERARKSALSFLEKGLYARLGTDAHNPGRLEKILGEGFRNIEKRVGAKILKKLLRGIETERRVCIECI